MTVYVESNFVLEIALGQNDATAAGLILQAAIREQVSIAIPSNALFEPFSTVNRRRDRRKTLRLELAREIGELERSEPHRQDVETMAQVPGLFLAIEEREKELLIRTIQMMVSTAAIIAIDARTYSEAVGFATAFGFEKMHDAIIFAAVRRDLIESARQGPHVFVTKDKDFAFPDVKNELERLDCRITFSFTAGAQLLRLERGLS